jgi:hypothetical protein
MTSTVFDELQDKLASDGVDAALAHLAARLADEQRFHELFDARLMQTRHRLGLPVVQAQSIDDLPEPVRDRMEEAYLDACREVGHGLLAQGRIQEAWMYLRPVGDKTAIAAALERTEPTDDNLEELVGVALHEGVHPRLGFELVLKHYGTCNAISRFEGAMYERPKADQQAVAALLIGHLHRELLDNLRADIARQEGAQPAEGSIESLVSDRDWLFEHDNYHVDTSHLSAVVRFARLVTAPEPLRQAADLTEYGRRLSRQYQYPGEEPFVDVYPHHGLFFRAQLGEQIDAALAHFAERARAVSVEEQGTAAAEVYIALLARLGRAKEAIEAHLQLLPRGARTSGFAPSLLELARQAGDFGRLIAVCRERQDVLGFAAGLVEASGSGELHD